MSVELKGSLGVSCIPDERYEELKINEAKLMAVMAAFKIRGITRSEILKILEFIETLDLRNFAGADERLVESLVKMEIKKMKGESDGKEESKGN